MSRGFFQITRDKPPSRCHASEAETDKTAKRPARKMRARKQMSLLNIFQSKAPAKSPAPKNQTAAPSAAAATPTKAAPANVEAAAAVKSLLGAFAEEAAADSAKIHAIGQQLMGVQTMLLNATDSHRAPEANAHARKEIKQILGDLRALNVEFSDTAKQLQSMSK